MPERGLDGSMSQPPDVQLESALVNWPGAGADTRIEFDFAKRIFVVDQILLKNGEQRLGLLRTEIDALKVADVDAGLVLLLKSPEDKEEVPDVHTNLHAVGVAL